MYLFISRVTQLLLLAAFLVASTGVSAKTPSATVNILWDGGFETGYGNAFWGVPWGNLGPNYRDMWDDGVVRLKTKIATRVYWLEDGTYTATAWVRQTPNATSNPRVRLTVTNLNYYRDRTKQAFSQRFSVSSKDDWQRVSFSFTVNKPDRRYFHVELDRSPDVIVDAVMLTPGNKQPSTFSPAQPIEAGFYIPDETNTYIDGEARDVFLMVHNHTAKPRRAAVTWKLYDHREELVKQATVDQSFASNKTTRIKLPLDDLPYSGYRLAVTVDDDPVIGDALVAILPDIPTRSTPDWGADANVTSEAGEFSSRLMRKLGMTTANTLSPGGSHARWKYVNPAPGVHKFDDATVDVPMANGIDVVGFLGLRYPPKWVKEKSMKGDKIIDKEFYINAFCDHVEAYVRKFGGRVKTIFFEDEIHSSAMAKDWPLLMACFKAAHTRAHKVADEMNVELTAGFNATFPHFWDRLFNSVPHSMIDVYAANSVVRPQYATGILNIARDKGLQAPMYYTAGVGQKSQLRKTSLINVRATNGNPPGLFAWQAVLHFHQNRPYGVEEPKYGPMVNFGYYDLRTMGQSVFLPIAGKTGVEYDNSPTLGLQAIAMLKHQILGMRPVRDHTKPYTLEGYPTASQNINAYLFRDKRKATVVVMTTDNKTLGKRWQFSGMNFSDLDIRDIFAQPIKANGDTLLTRELPIYIHTSVDQLPQLLIQLESLQGEEQPAPEKFDLAIGDYQLQVDPDLDGYFRLSRMIDGKKVMLIDRFQTVPALPRPSIEAESRPLTASATLRYGKLGVLSIVMSKQGIRINWNEDSARRTTVERRVHFRISEDGAGRFTTITEGDQVTTGTTRVDWGTLFDAKTVTKETTIDENGSTVSIDNFIEVEMPPAFLQNDAGPKTGLRWKRADGEAGVQATYRLGPYQGGGTRGLVRIKLDMYIK